MKFFITASIGGIYVLILTAGLLLVVGGSRGCNADMVNETTLIDLTAIGGLADCAIPGN